MNRFILFIGILFLGCSERIECLDYPTYPVSGLSPTLYVTSEDSNCVYNINYLGYIDGEILQSPGEMYKKGRKFFVKIYEPETDFFKLFDLSLSKGDAYDVSVTISGGKHKLQMQLDNIVKTKEKKVYVFRGINNFRFVDRIFDTVYFVTEEEGVIGSYYTYYENDVEIIINDRGNILKEYLNYTNKEFGSIDYSG